MYVLFVSLGCAKKIEQCHTSSYNVARLRLLVPRELSLRLLLFASIVGGRLFLKNLGFTVHLKIYFQNSNSAVGF